MKEYNTDVCIIGGGLGGIAAALAVARLGYSAIVTEEAEWIGGQLTSQGVPPDENPWIDSRDTGCTGSYRELRERIRTYYRSNYPLNGKLDKNRFFNPGEGNVSPLCHEPWVALQALYSMLMPYISSGNIQVWNNTIPLSADTEKDAVRSVICRYTPTGDKQLITADYFLDATELGDLLPMTGTEFMVGAESQHETDEPHARADGPNPLEQQAFSWVFALDYAKDCDCTIEKPETYDFWRSYKADFWPDKQLSWVAPEPVTLEPTSRPIFTGPMEELRGDDLWHFRRILYSPYYPAGFYDSDIISVNWPQIDYWLGPLVGVSNEEKQKHLYMARQLSFSMLYWMQTEAPRLEGGYGYPELRLRGDVMGTKDLAQMPYIRESRRIKAEFTVLEQHLGVEARGAQRGSEKFPDSVGIGSYRIDLHPSTSGRNYVDINNYPYQIPLGALIPVRMENLLPANKNLGVTHITNGCFRLHPVEWNIGEAAGALAAYCLKNKIVPRQVRNSSNHVKDFQQVLRETLRFELEWPEDLRQTSRDKLDPLGI